MTNRPAPNPYPFDSLEWYAHKEQTENYVPYHVGTKPDGSHCETMPRVVLVRPGIHRCPDCRKEFPTATAALAAIEKTMKNERVKPTVHPDWKLPEPPHSDCKPYAHLVGSEDGWDLYWATPEQAPEGDYYSEGDKSDPFNIEWPFGPEDVAHQEDFTALGFLDPEAA